MIYNVYNPQSILLGLSPSVVSKSIKSQFMKYTRRLSLISVTCLKRVFACLTFTSNFEICFLYIYDLLQIINLHVLCSYFFRLIFSYYMNVYPLLYTIINTETVHFLWTYFLIKDSLIISNRLRLTLYFETKCFSIRLILLSTSTIS